MPLDPPKDAPESEPDPQAESVEDILEQVANATGSPAGSGSQIQDAQALNEKYLRLHAEFENFRRRTARENIELMETANAELLKKILPTLENFARAFSAEHQSKTLEGFETGMRMIYNQLRDTLTEVGLEELNPAGDLFDPVLHDAVFQTYHETMEEGRVSQVYQKGYQLKKRILQHAKVVVSKGPATSSEPSLQSEERNIP